MAVLSLAHSVAHVSNMAWELFAVRISRYEKFCLQSGATFLDFWPPLGPARLSIIQTA